MCKPYSSPEQPEGVSPEPEFIPGRPVLIKSGSSIRNGTIDTVDPGAGQARVRLEGGSVVPLPLSVHKAVPIDLEETYQRAAKRAYLD